MAWCIQVCGILGLVLLLVHCQQGEDVDSLTPPPAGIPEEVQQATLRLIDLYRTALLQEDIDQLDVLLQPEDAGVSLSGLLQQPQTNGTAPTEVQTFLEERSTTFRTMTLINLQIPPETIQFATAPQRVMFQEVESLEEPGSAVTRTRVYHTTWQLVQEEVEGIVTVRIAGIQRTGPLVDLITRGQIQAAALTRLEILPGTFPLAAGTVTVPETGARSELVANAEQFYGVFQPPASTPVQPCVCSYAGRLVPPWRSGIPIDCGV
jgi:hypothetical protein